MVLVLWQNWGEYVGRQLPHFLAGATLTDVTISVGNRSLKTHRIILAFFSPFFKKMLEDVCEERPMVVVFPGINFDALKVIVSYMYHGQVNVPTDLLPAVIELAKMLKVKGLIELPMQLESVINNPHGCIDELRCDKNTEAEMSARGSDIPEGITSDAISDSILGEGGEIVELEVTSADAEMAIDRRSPSTSSPSSSTEVSHLLNATSSEKRVKVKRRRESLSEEQGQDSHPVLLQADDDQIPGVEDVRHSHIVKLSQSDGMGEVLLTSDHLSTGTGDDSSPCSNAASGIQEGAEGNEKKRKKSTQRYRPEKLQMALEDVRMGVGTLREIAEKWGVPHSTLSVYARSYGITTLQRNSDYNDESLEAAKQALKSGASYLKVSRDFNIPKSVLWRRCHRDGAGKDDSRGRCYTQEDMSRAREMLQDNKTISQVFRETQIPKTTVFRIKEQLIREGKLPPSSISRNVRLSRPPEQAVAAAVAACKEGLSQGQASEKFQVAKTTVWRRLKKLKRMEEEGSKRLCVDAATANLIKMEVVENDSPCAVDTAQENPGHSDISNYGIQDKSSLQEESSGLIKNKHFNILTSEGHVIHTRGSVVMSEAGKSEEGEGDRNRNTQFELEMPLVNLSGSGYQVVGSEIVIGGQQMVVLESSASHSLQEAPTSLPHSLPPSLPAGPLVVTSFNSMENLDELIKVEELHVQEGATHEIGQRVQQDAQELQ
ncbi:uncharacterized protein LOC143038138 [Oratosquilla oratoria]|uniref:uncharacterized protein LOC143038138 n=1 Tax=Oratosquilla oratoria TaxID=337810 RepID=UPI003F773866